MIHAIFKYKEDTFYGWCSECFYCDEGTTIYRFWQDGVLMQVPEDDIIEMTDKQNLIKKYPEYFI